MGKKKKAIATKTEFEEGETPVTSDEEAKKSNHFVRRNVDRLKERKLDQHLEDQISSGCLLACISSRPGQCGRADGYILDGKELEFYQKKIQRKKGKTIGPVVA